MVNLLPLELVYLPFMWRCSGGGTDHVVLWCGLHVPQISEVLKSQS